MAYPSIGAVAERSFVRTGGVLAASSWTVAMNHVRCPGILRIVLLDITVTQNPPEEVPIRRIYLVFQGLRERSSFRTIEEDWSYGDEIYKEFDLLGEWFRPQGSRACYMQHL